MSRTIRIHAFLTTSTPLHISSGVSGTYHSETGKVEQKPYQKGGTGVPCMLVQQMSIANKEAEYGSVQVPVIMANNIMGRLRRHAAAEVLAVIKDKGERIKTRTYSALMCGAASGSPANEDPTFEEYRTARAHAYLGLFGGGPKLFRRHVHCFNAVPYTSGSRPMFERCKHPFFDEIVHGVKSNNEWNLTRAAIQNRNDDLQEHVNVALASETIEDFLKQANERQVAILENKSKRKENSETTERVSTRSYTTFQFVIPGVVFPVCWEFKDVSDAQLGLFLQALDTFAHKEELGGLGRNGFGRFTLTDVVMTDIDDKLLDGGEGLFQENRLNRNHADVAQALSAWEQESQTYTGANLDSLFFEEVKDKKEKKPKKASQSAAKGEEESTDLFED